MRSYEKGLWLLILLLTAAVVYAVFFLVPPAMGLGSLVRIAFFHIPVAWVAVLAFLVSAWYAVRYLRRPSPASMLSAQNPPASDSSLSCSRH